MEFIPLNLAGVYRPLRFINFLAEKGEYPIVISFEIDETVKKLYPNIDLELNKQLHKNVTVYRVPLSIITKENRIQSFLNIYFNLSDGYRKFWKKNLGIIKEKIRDGNLGRVAIDGDEWQCRSTDETSLSVGQKVKVVDRESIILTVESPDKYAKSNAKLLFFFGQMEIFQCVLGSVLGTIVRS